MASEILVNFGSSDNLNQFWLTINSMLWYSFQGDIYFNDHDINP